MGNHTRRLAALLGAVGLTLAACGGSDASSGGDSGSADAGDGGGGERTFTLWHYESPDSAMGIAWDAAIEEFEATHPDVTVVFEEKGFEQIQDTAQMVLNSDEAPDLMEYNKGNASTGLLSSQGLLTDLTDVATERGWDGLLPASLQTTARYTDGVMGGDSWYGVPNYGEFVMVYYNVDLFAENGVEVPTTLAEFEAAMDTFVAAGITPISVGASEYPAQQIFYELVLGESDRSLVNAFQLYEADVDFHGPEFTAAAETLSSWVDAGYISSDATAINAEDMGVDFIAGNYPMMISGSWWYGRMISEATAFEWSTFLFPGSDMHPGSSGNLWVVPENSENKDLAYDFIDITMSPEIQALLGNSGGVPVAADPADITDEKSQELIANFNTVLESDGLAFYPDWPVPGYYDVMVSAVQNLISGSSVDDVLDELEDPYQTHVDSLG